MVPNERTDAMTIGFTELARSAAAAGEITPQTLIALRQMGWSDGTIGRLEAESLLMLNRALDRPSGDWVDFFVDALCEFVLDAGEPAETCDECEVHWLIGMIETGGSPITMAELELLVRLVERAGDAPDSLRLYALKQIQLAVLDGIGPTRLGKSDDPCHITGAECRIVRRILLGSGNGATVAPSPQICNVLDQIDRATDPQADSPEWPLLLDDIARLRARP